MHYGKTLLMATLVVALCWGAARAEDTPQLDNATLAPGNEVSALAASLSDSLAATAQRARELRERYYAADYLNFINGARLAGLGYEAAEDAGEWYGSLTYSAGVMQRGGGAWHFDQGTRLDLGYYRQVDDNLEIGISISGGLGNLPGDDWFGFGDSELNGKSAVDEAFMKLSVF